MLFTTTNTKSRKLMTNQKSVEHVKYFGISHKPIEQKLLHIAPLKTFLLVYHDILYPRQNYGCFIWGYHVVNMLINFINYKNDVCELQLNFF